MKKQTTTVFNLLLGIALISTAQAGYEIVDVTDAWKDNFRSHTRVYLDYGDNRIPNAE